MRATEGGAPTMGATQDDHSSRTNRPSQAAGGAHSLASPLTFLRFRVEEFATMTGFVESAATALAQSAQNAKVGVAE